MTNFLAIVVAIASVLFAPVVVGDCDGYQDPDLITKLDFSNATVAANTLHEAGGELRFASTYQKAESQRESFSKI